MHIATQGLLPVGSVLRCKCGKWKSDTTQTARDQRLAHQAHRVEMGEVVKPLGPTPTMRLRAAEDKILVLQAYLRSVEEELDLLHALRAAGVDNWEGYSYAHELLRERSEDEDA